MGAQGSGSRDVVGVLASQRIDDPDDRLGSTGHAERSADLVDLLAQAVETLVSTAARNADEDILESLSVNGPTWAAGARAAGLGVLHEGAGQGCLVEMKATERLIAGNGPRPSAGSDEEPGKLDVTGRAGATEKE